MDHRMVKGAPRGAELSTWLARLSLPPWRRLTPKAPLGAGGVGEVHAMGDAVLGRRVASKLLRDELSHDDAARARLVREARIVAQLDHPHIAPLHDVGQTDDGRLYFTMKLVEGHTLRSLLDGWPPGPLAPGTLLDAIDAVLKVCDATAFAHTRGVLHLDIKPDNVLVGDHGAVYLMDWGTARLREDDREPPIIIGTPGYMPPEQAEGRRSDLDPRADVFTLGATLYHVLARRPPYREATLAETIIAAQACEAPPPSALARPGDVPAELDRIVMKAMARDRRERYASVDALKSDLVRFVRGGGDFPRVTYVSGATIVQEGERGDAAYVIVSGRCRVEKRVHGETIALRELGPGEVFGETAILTTEPRSASVIAMEDTIVSVIDKTQLEREIDAMKLWIGAFVRSLARRFLEADEARASGS